MIDDLLAELASLGWLLNNCYQVDADLWRVNLRRPDPTTAGDWFTDWSEGPTFAEALEDCMIKLQDAEFEAEVATVAMAEVVGPKLSLSQRLGLTKPFERRI